MNTSLHEFDGSDNGHNGGMIYPGWMPSGGVGGDGLPRILWRGRWLLLLSLVAAAGTVCLYLQTATPMYESTARILVDKPGLPVRAEGPQPVGSTSANYLQTQANMITSREIIAAALQDPNVLTLPTLRNIDFPVEEVIRTLSALVGKNTDIVNVTAQSAYPDDAAQIVNAVVRAYICWHEVNKQLSTADLLQELNSQLEKRYQELRTKRKERMMFEQRNPEVLESVQGGLVSKTLEVLRQDLATARLNVIQEDAYYEGLQRFEAEPEAFRQYVYSRRGASAAPLDEGERSRLKQELLATQLELEGFSAGAVVSHTLVTQLQNREAQLQARIVEVDKAFVRKQLALARTFAEDVHAREKQLADLYEKEFAKVQSLSGRDAEYAFLLSECEMMQSLCDSLLKQIDALDLSASFQGLSIHVLERAVAAREPSSPQPVRVVVIGLVLGLLAGVGLALLRDRRDQRVRSADEITAIVGARVLGAVPSIAERGLVARGQRLRFAAGSPEAEAYRAIRTALLCHAPREQALIVLVTSPGNSEGKTTLVSNLGIAMAQAGQKTLILDADLRHPMQHQIFTAGAHDPGLTDVLSGAATLDEATWTTEVPGLTVLASGRNAPNPAELLGGQAFVSLLRQLKGEYDCILVDSAPVGEVTDAQILALHCGLILLVLRAERSSRLAAQRAREALLTVGARFTGVVVNHVSRRNHRYSQCRYSLYGYPHGDYSLNDGGSRGKELAADVSAPPEGASS